MPAKKTTTAAANTETEKKTTVKKTAAKKTAAKKTTAEKTAETVKTVETKAPAKKTCARKPAAKKTAAKKTSAKKTAVKAEETKPVVSKKSVKDYVDIINWKKGEANGMDWLYIEVKADDLLTEVEAGVDNLATVCEAILSCMLEGDSFVVDSAAEGRVDPALTVRYYCDNLSPERKKYFDR